MKAFITGSRVYGTPREDSDTDLVILTDQATVDLLVTVFGDEMEKKAAEYAVSNPDYLRGLAASLKIGRLNLLLCVEQKHYDAWLEGTDLLKAKAPVTRLQAVELFDVLRAKFKDKA